MATNILDDILNNFLTVDLLFDWLSNKIPKNEENIFLNQYDCNQVDFVSYFLVFLKEESLRFFQANDAETSKENSHSNKMVTSTPEVDKSSLFSKMQQISTPTQNFDLDSLQSFPTLSSCSSYVESEKKCCETNLSHSTNDSTNQNTSEKKCRRVKLFSETLEGNSLKTDFDLLEEELKESPKSTISNSKPCKNNSLSCLECSVTPESEFLSGLITKSNKKNQSLDLTCDNSHSPKIRSFSGDPNHKSQNKKTRSIVTLGDFILSDSINECKKEKKPKARKRINPTRVSSLSQLSFNSSFSDKTESPLESSKLSALDDRQSFKIDSEKLHALLSEKLDEIKTPVKNSASFLETQPDPDLVTSVNELNILAQIYGFLINENYCQNLMIELCFIISLLVIQDYNKKPCSVGEDEEKHLKQKKSNVFSSIHNCVHFAVETLWEEKCFLMYLNLPTLKLLSENKRIEKFNVKLKEYLVSAYLKKQSSEEVKRLNGVMKAGMQDFVSFQCETDNLENFTSKNNFQLFRKQRDLFYNILAIWEANHSVTEWKFSSSLSSQIRTLLSISSDPINLLHLARLFRNQLVMSCCGENQPEGEVNEEILQLLPSADPNKILRLRARLTSSPKRQGPCPLPDFTGHQEFYKDFILATSHSSFHQHLKNSLCDEILRLDDTDFIGDHEDGDLNLDEQTQERYLQCTNILRVLAKFLGFVEFLPYRGEKPSERTLGLCCSVRNSTLPLFDALSCLTSAIKKQKLTLTVPWMVSYLSMIDPFSAHLKIYKNVWRLLIFMYKHLKTLKNARNSFYLKLNLGWIFHLPNFPSEMFYSVLDESSKTSAQVFGVSFEEETKIGLDCCEFVGESILYAVCPFLHEISAILSENSGCSVRHVRPVTTRTNPVPDLQESKQLQLRLESSFLHNQSSSTRKTVEFVTERVASVAIKRLMHIIRQMKKTFRTQWENSEDAECESEMFAEKRFQELQTKCEKEIWDLSRKRSELVMKALLSEDLQGPVAETCAKIAARQAAEKARRWMESHVTLTMVKNEFLPRATLEPSEISTELSINSNEAHALAKFDKSVDSRLPSPKHREIVHDPKAWPASQSLKSVRELLWKIHEENSSEKEVAEVLEETLKMTQNRDDVISAAEKILLFLLVDLIVAFCIHTDGEVHENLLKKLTRVLKSLDLKSHPHTNIERIVCPRNVALIRRKAKNGNKAWFNIGNLIMRLMEDEILTKEQVETQLLSLLRLHWEKVEATQFSTFLSQILSRYSKNNAVDKFSLLLEYMIETFNDDEPKSESLG